MAEEVVMKGITCPSSLLMPRRLDFLSLVCPSTIEQLFGGSSLGKKYSDLEIPTSDCMIRGSPYDGCKKTSKPFEVTHGKSRYGEEVRGPMMLDSTWLRTAVEMKGSSELPSCKVVGRSRGQASGTSQLKRCMMRYRNEQVVTKRRIRYNAFDISRRKSSMLRTTIQKTPRT